MLSIGQLAACTGVTVRAVRHYHQIGLLPAPERTYAGYRTYGADAVVRLIRIRTLADAGVPLARVQRLLDADLEEFASAIDDIDRKLRADIRRLQKHRQHIRKLGAGEQLALPDSVVEYLGQLRDLGIDERYIEVERDSWIMVAAQSEYPIDSIVAQKRAVLEHPDMVRLYRLINEGLDWDVDDPRIEDMADIVESLSHSAIEAGASAQDQLEDAFVDVLDAAATQAFPVAERLHEILKKRGWTGWTRLEFTPRR